MFRTSHRPCTGETGDDRRYLEMAWHSSCEPKINTIAEMSNIPTLGMTRRSGRRSGSVNRASIDRSVVSGERGSRRKKLRIICMISAAISTSDARQTIRLTAALMALAGRRDHTSLGDTRH